MPYVSGKHALMGLCVECYETERGISRKRIFDKTTMPYVQPPTIRMATAVRSTRSNDAAGPHAPVGEEDDAVVV